MSGTVASIQWFISGSVSLYKGAFIVRLQTLGIFIPNLQTNVRSLNLGDNFEGATYFLLILLNKIGSLP